MSSVLPFTDIVFGNETEAAAYAESFDLNTTDIGEIAMKIAQLPKVSLRYRTKLNTKQNLSMTFFNTSNRKMAAEADWW